MLRMQSFKFKFKCGNSGTEGSSLQPPAHSPLLLTPSGTLCYTGPHTYVRGHSSLHVHGPCICSKLLPQTALETRDKMCAQCSPQAWRGGMGRLWNLVGEHLSKEFQNPKYQLHP